MDETLLDLVMVARLRVGLVPGALVGLGLGAVDGGFQSIGPNKTWGSAQESVP